MLAALLAIVALNAAFVLVVAWLYLVVLPTLFGGGYLYAVGEPTPSPWELVQLPMSLPALAVATLAFLLGQVYYGYTRVLDDVRTGTVGPDEYPELHAIVGRLAASADVPKPAVSVVESQAPNSFTVGRGHASTIVVTEPLLAVLGPDELETVLAHEIAHVRHRDVTLMTVTGLFVAIAERTLQTARLLRRGITDRDRISERQKLALDWLLPVALFTYVFVAPVLWLFPPVARFASGELSRQREFAADRAAADLTGSPTTLARALITVHESAPEVAETDLRRERASLQALCVVPHGVVGPDATVATDRERDEPSAAEAGAASSATAASVGAAEPNTDASDDAASDSRTTGESAVTDEDGAEREPRSESRRGVGHLDDAPQSEIDPDHWLGTTGTSSPADGRTHPPIHDRVERLVALAREP